MKLSSLINQYLNILNMGFKLFDLVIITSNIQLTCTMDVAINTDIITIVVFYKVLQ